MIGARDKSQGVREFFDRYPWAGIVLPAGWFGRPDDSYYQLDSVTETAEGLTITFNDSVVLSITKPSGMKIVHSKSPRLVIERCEGGELRWNSFGSGAPKTRAFAQGPIELHAPPRIIPGVPWSAQSDDEETDDQFN